jgi:hypothetical protein
MGVNSARVFIQNSRQIASEFKDVAANSNIHASTTSTNTHRTTQ